MSKPITTSLVAAVLFAAMQFATSALVAFALLANTTMIVRFLGEQQGQLLYSVTAENNSLRSIDSVAVFVSSPSMPTIISSTGPRPPLVQPGGRTHEKRISFGNLARGERASALIALEGASSTPSFDSKDSRPDFILVADETSLQWLKIANIVINTITMTLVYGCIFYFAELRFAERAKRIDQLSADVSLIKQEKEQQEAKVQAAMQKAQEQIAELRAVFQRMKLMYQRRTHSLIRENSFWRKLMADLISLQGLSQTQARQTVEGMLGKAGIHAPNKEVSDQEFLEVLESLQVAPKFGIYLD